MLIHWQSHQEYLNFLHETKVHLDSYRLLFKTCHRGGFEAMPSIVSFRRNVGHAAILIILFSIFSLDYPCLSIHPPTFRDHSGKSTWESVLPPPAWKFSADSFNRFLSDSPSPLVFSRLPV